MTDEIFMTRSSGNVFADIGVADAEEHYAKARLVSHISDIIEARNMNQTAAAAVLGIDESKMAALLDGHFRGFSIYRLMSFLTALGNDVEIVTHSHRDSANQMEIGHVIVR